MAAIDMSAVYVVTYRPLCSTRDGRRAIELYGFKPFIDASCRREPDLEAKWPTITALCRGRNFAPRLHEGDRVVYLSAAWRGIWRLVAMLEVEKRFESHPEAAAWFRSKGVPLPSNCMVPGNRPYPLSKTGGYGWCSDVKEWDRGYRQRADMYGVVLACTIHHLELDEPPIVTRQNWIEWNGSVPATRNPKTTPHLWEPLLWRATSRNSPV